MHYSLYSTDLLRSGQIEGGRQLRPVVWPEVIRRVIEETGCGLLLDVSHARLAANYLGMDAREYVNALPVERTREIIQKQAARV